MMGDVERLPLLGALPLTRHLFPIPLQMTCSPFGPQNTIFSLWVMFGRSSSFPWCARCFLCPRCQTPAAPGLCGAERSQDTLMHVREHRPGVNTPFLIQDCCSWGGEEKKPCVVLNVDQKKSGVQICTDKIENLNLLVHGNCSWLKHYCIPDIL